MISSFIFWLHGVQFCEQEERATYVIQKSGKFPLSECNSIMISTVDSEFASTCMGKENETLVFMLDVCHMHEDLMTK